MSTLIRPRISEKAIALSEIGQYVFDVPDNANKITVAAAIEKQFSVKVAGVNMLIHKGKHVHWRGKGGKRTAGQRSDVKKAIVKLQKGQSIKLFDEGDK